MAERLAYTLFSYLSSSLLCLCSSRMQITISGNEDNFFLKVFVVISKQEKN